MLLAMALESLPPPQSWPPDNKLGGFVGDLLLWQSGRLSGLPLWLHALVAFPIGLAALFFALGLTPAEWRVLLAGVAGGSVGARRGTLAANRRTPQTDNRH